MLYDCEDVSVKETGRIPLTRPRLTFFVGVDRTNVSLEMLPAVEALFTALDFAHVHTYILRVSIAGTADGCTILGGHPAATAFLCQVGDW